MIHMADNLVSTNIDTWKAYVCAGGGGGAKKGRVGGFLWLHQITSAPTNGGLMEVHVIKVMLVTRSCGCRPRHQCAM